MITACTSTTTSNGVYRLNPDLRTTVSLGPSGVPSPKTPLSTVVLGDAAVEPVAW